MSATTSCPRCSGPLRPPGLMSSEWECAVHGAVAPYAPLVRPTSESVAQLLARSRVPVWAPLPFLPGWSISGLAAAGDERTGPRATAVALYGPSPLGGPADLVLVAEEPGIGLGARLSGGGASDADLADADALVRRTPDAKVMAAGHATPLWSCPAAEDRVAFVGEALGVWFRAVLWPPEAELVLLEHVELHDLRHEAHAQLELPVGPPSPRLV